MRPLPRHLRGVWAAVLGGTLVAAAALGACGVPRDDEPLVIAEGGPFDSLLQTTTTAAVETGSNVEVKLWFLDEEQHLTEVTRAIRSRDADTVLRALVEGLAEGESAYTTTIPTGTRIEAIRPAGDQVLEVVLSREILNAVGPLQKAAFAQLVYTATGLTEGRNGVLFKYTDENGQEQPARPPTDRASQSDTPLTRDDFASLREPPPTVTTTVPPEE